MPQARGHKAKYREDAFYELEKVAKQRVENKTVRLQMQNTYIGSKIFKAVNIYKAYGENVHNVIGFETANDSIGTVRNYTGEPDDPYSKNNISTERAFIDKSEKDLMKDLDKNRDTPSFVYAGVSTRIDILAEGLTQLSHNYQVSMFLSITTTTGQRELTMRNGTANLRKRRKAA